MDHNLPEFQFEALWCLTNIASGTSDNAQSIALKGGIPKILALIDSNIQELQEQAIWCAGNIAGDSAKLRDKVIQEKGFEKILKHLYTAERNSLIKQCVWSISNFCRTKPAPEYEIMQPCVDLVIKAILKLDNDIEFLIDACWILSYMTENHKRSIRQIIDSKIMTKLLTFLE